MDETTMSLIDIYTRQQVIENGTLIRFEDFLRGEGVGRVLRTAFRQIWRCVRRFGLGELIITPGAGRAVQVVDILHCLQRHQLGDWGELEDADWFANDTALTEGGRLISVYHAQDKKREGETVRVCVISEWNREATTVLLPGDY